MIDSPALLADLKKQLTLLQADLKERAEDPDDAWGQRLREQHATALARGRTGHAWVTWRDGEVDQAAVAWLIATTFVRFCEDNSLLAGARDETGRPVPTPWLAGPGDRRDRAVEHETAFFRETPSLNRRDWMQQAFGVLAAQPAGRALVDPRHSMVWNAPISAEAADRLVNFWRTTDPGGALVHDFTDPDLGTRFLGDLYQDLSEHAKKTFALLQTPDFVEEFILDQTLTPALAEFGLEGLKLIDPTCGSGHFLLGAFARLNREWAEAAPALDVRERVQKAMDSIHGVDLNPFAVAIARFRLTVAGLRAVGLRSLVEAPATGYHLAVGDSLLAAQGIQGELNLDGDEQEVFEYDEEDISEYGSILEPGQYHVVIGNPPYITVKDSALNEAYRAAYPTCHRQYALSVPFMELFFRLAIRGYSGQAAGYSGQITANSFMKREFGRKVIENLLSGRADGNPVDLTHVIDTSGAYIPGHGTPTVILVGRRRLPQTDTVRAVLGVRGEPGQPADPAKGVVWTEIVDHLAYPGFDGSCVSVTDLDRATLATHPWSLSGGAAQQLLDLVEATPARLGAVVSEIGAGAVTREDDAYLLGVGALKRRRISVSHQRRLVDGEFVRDFLVAPDAPLGLWPYHPQTLKSDDDPRVVKALWPWRANLSGRVAYGKNQIARGLEWFEYSMFFVDRYRAKFAIAFAEVATHNHFVLARGGKVFKQTAPVIKLPESATEQDHLNLLGVLNSSTACFWLKQVCYPKGGDPVGADGARVSAEGWDDRYAFNATNIGRMPLPHTLPGARGRRLNVLAGDLVDHTPPSTVENAADDGARDLRDRVSNARAVWSSLRQRMVFEQEELDWEVYQLYGLVDEDLTYTGEMPEDERLLRLGERAFEVALARKVAAGTEETTWFERHGSTPLTELPADWPDDYRALVERRLQLIATDRSIELLERPEFKRRWATPGWDGLLNEALTEAILDRLEQRELWFDAAGQPAAKSVAELADAVRHDTFMLQCIQLLAGVEEPDLTGVLADVLKEEPVPYLAALRYKPPGIEKYRTWQRVWELQRREDAGEKVTIEVPPKYKPADFLKTGYWRARGKLDVPKERFIAYPGAVRAADPTPVIGWAGWDYAEQAQALAREFGNQQALGAEREQLLPLVAGLVELEPWLDQWHAEVDPRYGSSPAAAIHQVVEHYAAQLGVTRNDLDAWRPPAAARGRRTRANASAETEG